MPSPYIKQLAKETGKSVSELERYWKKAKEITKDDFDVAEDNFQDKHFAYATAIVKRMAGVKESVITVSDFLQSGKTANDFIAEVVSSGDFPSLDKGTATKKDNDEDVLKDPEDKEDETEKVEAIKKEEEIPDPKDLEVGAGYYTENGIMVEALDKNGKSYMVNFASIEDAQGVGFEITEDMII